MVITNEKLPRYRQLADAMEEAVKLGAISAGQRLPSVRALAKAEEVSISTALAVYRDLEQRGVVEARPKSGYFARAACCLPTLDTQPVQSRPEDVTTTGIMQAFTSDMDDFKGTAFGSAIPAASLLPVRDMARAITASMHREGEQGLATLSPMGLPELRQAIAARMLNSGSKLGPDDVVVTNGCSEAISLALQSCTEPGDLVAVECPSFYGTLLAIHDLGRKVVEIETAPDTGLVVDAFERACKKHRPRALIVSPSAQNPTGACMSGEAKMHLLEVARKHDVIIIEDDVFGELAREEGLRKWSLHSRDVDNRVIYCSSFSKVLAPGIRIGWIAPGRFLEQVRTRKMVRSWGGPNLVQRGLLRLLKSSSLDARIRHMIRETECTRRHALNVIDGHFPAGVSVSGARFGYLLWLRLPDGVDTTRLYRAAVEEVGINFAPGSIFSATGRFHDHLRLNLAMPWSLLVEEALAELGHFLQGKMKKQISVMPISGSY